MMDDEEIYKLGQKLFGVAMAHASQEGETVVEHGGDEHYWHHASGPELLRAATSYFESAT